MYNVTAAAIGQPDDESKWSDDEDEYMIDRNSDVTIGNNLGRGLLAGLPPPKQAPPTSRLTAQPEPITDSKPSLLAGKVTWGTVCFLKIKV